MRTGSSRRLSAGGAGSLVDIDTRRIACDERADYWHASVCDEFVPLLVDPTAHELDGRISGFSVAEVRLRRIVGSEHRFVRRPVGIEEPIAVIGRRCGLGDPAHFNRLFKARFAMPPGELRRMSAAADSAALVTVQPSSTAE